MMIFVWFFFFIHYQKTISTLIIHDSGDNLTIYHEIYNKVNKYFKIIFKLSMLSVLLISKVLIIESFQFFLK